MMKRLRKILYRIILYIQRCFGNTYASKPGAAGNSARLHNETREREISDAANEFERDMADTMV